VNGRRVATLLGGGALAAGAVVFAVRFPWREMVAAVQRADWTLLLAAVLINITAMVAKGWAWHLLLRPVAPHRWRSAQAATFVGAAVNCLSVAVGGEAARIHVLAQRDGVRYRDAAAGVVISRIAEGLALVLFVVGIASFLPPQGWARVLRIGAWSALFLMLWAWAAARRGVPARYMPAWLTRLFDAAWSSVSPRTIAAPVALGLFNWFAEWATFHLTILALGIPVTAAGSLTALLAANLGGIPRLTPGNVGVLQASVVLALAVHGHPQGPALAAGLALQAVQTLPMLAIGFGFAGRDVLQLLRASEPPSARTMPLAGA